MVLIYKRPSQTDTFHWHEKKVILFAGMEVWMVSSVRVVRVASLEKVVIVVTMVTMASLEKVVIVVMVAGMVSLVRKVPMVSMLKLEVEDMDSAKVEKEADGLRSLKKEEKVMVVTKEGNSVVMVVVVAKEVEPIKEGMACLASLASPVSAKILEAAKVMASAELKVLAATMVTTVARSHHHYHCPPYYQYHSLQRCALE